MTATSLEKTTEPVGGVPAAEAIQPVAAAIKPWQVAAAVLAVVITVLGFMWQMQTGLSGIRQEVREGDASLRQEMAEIRTLQIQIVDRLSRIEGFLGVGLPDDLAARTRSWLGRIGERPGRGVDHPLWGDPMLRHQFLREVRRRV